MSKRVTITLSDEEHAELIHLSELFGHPPATVAGDMLSQAMHDHLCGCGGGSETMERIQYLMAVPPIGTA